MDMLGFFSKHLVDYHRGEGLFISNKKEVKLGLKVVAIISSLRVVNSGFTFRDNFSLSV